MRQLVILIAIAEIARARVQVENAVILLNDSFLSLAGSFRGYDVQLFTACGHHSHELHARAYGSLAACRSALEEVRRNAVHAAYEVDIFLREGEAIRQAPHRLSARKRRRAYRKS